MSLYLGWGILILGLIFLLWASRSRRTRTRRGRGEGKATVVESGMYAVVRHPEFLGHTLIFVGLVLIAQYWASIR